MPEPSQLPPGDPPDGWARIIRDQQDAIADLIVIADGQQHTLDDQRRIIGEQQRSIDTLRCRIGELSRRIELLTSAPSNTRLPGQ